MSGGHFEYNQYRIDEIRRQLEEEYNNDFCEKEDNGEFYDRIHGITQAQRKAFKSEIVILLKELQVVFDKVGSVDWYFSGDDGYETCMEKLRGTLPAKHGKARPISDGIQKR